MTTAYGFTEYGGPDTQSYFDVTLPPRPVPANCWCRSERRASTPADWKVRAGTRKDTVPVTLPAVLGREVSGVVIGVGPRVTEFEVGDEVFGATATGFGGYAASTLLNVSSTAHKPPTVSWADAAVLTVAAGTAYDALHDLGLKPGGATLLLLGAGGGVGRSTIALALARSINVIGVASESKRTAIEEAGARWVASGGRLRRRRVRVVPPSRSGRGFRPGRRGHSHSRR